MPSQPIIIVISSVVNVFDIMKIFNDPNEPHPIAIVNRLKVGERRSDKELRYMIVLWRAEQQAAENPKAIIQTKQKIKLFVTAELIIDPRIIARKIVNIMRLFFGGNAAIREPPKSAPTPSRDVSNPISRASF